ncbi:MAG: hypothetical protein M4579_001454 [Chaenotheca gracillima]|nr:MAG: hypothetical protein M4579_001454 [Chaenotheca gracillima]
MQTETMSLDGIRGLGISDSRSPEVSKEMPLTPSRQRKTPYEQRDATSTNATVDIPPTPPQKDSPSTPLSPAYGHAKGRSLDNVGNETQSYFNPFGLQRTESVYSLSRVSLGSQISQLTALQLPDPSTISSNVEAIPTAPAAGKVLHRSADMIQRWIRKAMGLLETMYVDDDEEWAAAGGRQGLADLDSAISRFEGLITVYVAAIEQLQLRGDISKVPGKDLESLVSQMEAALGEWNKLRNMMKLIKEHIELAMEWEELWNNVLGDIGNEVDELNHLVFDMEEKRHQSLTINEDHGGGDAMSNLDLGELETIVEDSPLAGQRSHVSNRLSLPPNFSTSSPVASPGPPVSQEDSSLLALFARMQPLRASLDFLPMRLSSFNSRAQDIYPTACEELNSRCKTLESEWKKIQADAESLRRELGEDRWVGVFKNAGRQAQKMCESVRRSLVKLREAIDAGTQQSNPASLARKMESFEAKKMHYGPAIERVLAIVGKGLSDRFTVNGEVLRLLSDMEQQWKALEKEMEDMDHVLEELHSKDNPQLRDSISSSISMDRSASGSGFETPGSSPASSVIMTGHEPSTPHGNGKVRPNSARDSSLPRPSGGRRGFSMPPSSFSPLQTSSGGGPRKTPISRFSSASRSSSRSASPSVADRRLSSTPTNRPSFTDSDFKPRWNASTSTRDTVIGHHFRPLSPSTTTPRTYRSATPSGPGQYSAPHSSRSSIPLPSPLRRDGSISPALSSPTLPTISFPDRRPGSSLAGNRGPNRRRSALPERTRPLDRGGEDDDLGINSLSLSSPLAVPRPRNTRPASAMASSQRPAPRVIQTKTSAMRLRSGRESSADTSRPRGGVDAERDRPKWR